MARDALINETNNLVQAINRGLLAAQEHQECKRLTGIEISYSQSSNPDLTFEVYGKRHRLIFNTGLFEFMSMLNNILMSSIVGPETGDRPLCSYKGNFIASLALSTFYYTGKKYYHEMIPNYGVPRDHPYNSAVGALLISQIAFVLAHEYAHIILNHDREPINVLGRIRAGVAMPLKAAQRFRHQETEADSLAARMLLRYLPTHSEFLVQDLGVAGPGVFFQWLAFCESMVGSVLKHYWVPELHDLASRVRTPDDDSLYVHLHAHPLGSERAKAYYSMIDWDQFSPFTVGVAEACGHVVESFLADHKDEKRRMAVLAQGG